LNPVKCFLLLLALFVGSARAEAPPEIRDPFFEFFMALVDGDSLGVWDQADLQAVLSRSDRVTKLPVERVVRIERRALTPGEVEIRMGMSARRLIRIELDAELALPMPYSILGYNPGTIHISRVLQAVEWNLRSPHLTLPARDDEPGVAFRTRGLRALRLDEGHIVLDVDYLIDKLLGPILDDTWCEAFVVGRISEAPETADNGLTGIALGRSRGGKAVSGSLDFSRDKVQPNGRPVTRTLSAYARAWVAPYDLPEDGRPGAGSPEAVTARPADAILPG